MSYRYIQLLSFKAQCLCVNNDATHESFRLTFCRRMEYKTSIQSQNCSKYYHCRSNRSKLSFAAKRNMYVWSAPSQQDFAKQQELRREKEFSIKRVVYS